MNRANKTRFQIGVMLCMAFLFFGFSPSKILPRLWQKLNAAVQTTFEVNDFSLEEIKVNSGLIDRTTITLNGENLFRIIQKEALVGYAYLGEAPSMKSTFDYVVLFNKDLSIKKTKVLIYREDYGRQIGSQRWLRQFIDKKVGESITYGSDIDAISGATISAKSMTKALNDVLTSMEVLRDENILNQLNHK
ncbi:FMN-binding protein [Flagellimonas sp. CMM7]|uniref:FMN-binding protein n=1 Tax=Flagellimonas sp. CMM7 TaxID=2654676 RepID=UPI0013D2F50A|nr:FMN-binding protein [Flagellimonas sp. CMM7]UII78374.1 FMN-binding protein [Flagellimonas sp. CMM7]